jgi:hypothetical protein
VIGVHPSPLNPCFAHSPDEICISGYRNRPRALWGMRGSSGELAGTEMKFLIPELCFFQQYKIDIGCLPVRINYAIKVSQPSLLFQENNMYPSLAFTLLVTVPFAHGLVYKDETVRLPIRFPMLPTWRGFPWNSRAPLHMVPSRAPSKRNGSIQRTGLPLHGDV